MSASHKEALARGRQMSRTVNSYLAAMTDNRPKRGRRRTAESIESRLAAIETSLPGASPVKRLQMIQERNDLRGELKAMKASTSANDLASLERDFVAIAKEYGESQGIAKAAWREMGVSPDVLKKAGI